MEFAPTPTADHSATSPEESGGKFRGVCRCGWKSTPANTPSTAFQRSQDHVNRVGEVRDSLTRLNQEGDDLGNPDEGPRYAARKPVKKAAAPRTPKREPIQTKCGCGCGGAATQRTEVTLVFLPGHDARLLSILAKEVAAGTTTKDDALARVAERPALQAKLKSRLG